jgi:hypothetical protein
VKVSIEYPRLTWWGCGGCCWSSRSEHSSVVPDGASSSSGAQGESLVTWSSAEYDIAQQDRELRRVLGRTDIYITVLPFSVSLVLVAFNIFKVFSNWPNKRDYSAYIRERDIEDKIQNGISGLFIIFQALVIYLSRWASAQREVLCTASNQLRPLHAVEQSRPSPSPSTPAAEPSLERDEEKLESIREEGEEKLVDEGPSNTPSHCPSPAHPPRLPPPSRPTKFP